MVKNWIRESFNLRPGNAEAFAFIFVVPLMLLLSLILEYLFDEPSKSFSNELCTLMFQK